MLSDSPADEGGDDDAPGSTAAVCIRLLGALLTAATQPAGVDEEEQEVQSQAGQSYTAQQQDGLRKRREDSVKDGAE